MALGTENFWTNVWNQIINITGDDNFNVFVYGTTILTFSVYWIFGGIFTFMDLTNKPAFLRKYKIQHGTHEPLDKQKFFKVSFILLKFRVNC